MSTNPHEDDSMTTNPDAETRNASGPAIIITDIDESILRNNTDPIDKTIAFLDNASVPVIILTDRSEDDRARTESQLAEFDVDYALMMMNDGTEDAITFKTRMIKAMNQTYDIKLGIDADQGVRDVYESLGIVAADPSALPLEVDASASAQYKQDEVQLNALPTNDETAEAVMEANEAPESLADCLAEQVADLTVARTRAHGFHFNVKGAGFYSAHKLFQKVYEQMDNALDSVGEAMLQCGFDAPYRMMDVARLSELGDGPIVADTPEAMAADLVEVFDDLLEGYNECIARATLENKQGVLNLIAGLIDESTKLQWFLRSTASLQPQTTTPGGEYPVSQDASNAVTDAQAAEAMPHRSSARVILERTARPVEYVEPAMRAKVDERGVEQRIIETAKIELRAMGDMEDGGGMQLTGYGAVFNSPSEPLPFTETIAPGAFARSLKSRNEIKLLMDHSPGRVLASRRAGTLRLSEDAYGLRVEADLPDTTEGRDLSVLLKRGDITSMSFGFTVPSGGDYWSDENNRELRDIRLHEVSVVAFPAYAATQVGVRSVEQLASSTGLDADLLSDAMNALERGDKLTLEQAGILQESVAKLAENPSIDVSASISSLQAELDAKMRVAA